MPSRRGEERASQVFKRSRRFRSVSKTLGLRVRALRQERKLTLEQAAERSHMDFKHWQKVEAATVNVSLVTLIRIADGLGVPVAELFTGEGSGEAKKNG